MKYKNLNEALVNGVEVASIDDNGEYVEYLKYANGKYFIEHWVLKHGHVIKSAKTLEGILKYKKYASWKYATSGYKKIQYSIEEVEKYIEETININTQNSAKFYYRQLLNKINDYKTYEILVTKYFFESLSIYIEIKDLPIFGVSKNLFTRIANDEVSFIKYCKECIQFLKEQNLTDNWFNEEKVEIEINEEDEYEVEK